MMDYTWFDHGSRTMLTMLQPGFICKGTFLRVTGSKEKRRYHGSYIINIKFIAVVRRSKQEIEEMTAAQTFSPVTGLCLTFWCKFVINYVHQVRGVAGLRSLIP